MQVLNVAAYRFVALGALDARRGELRSHCSELKLKGTVLLSPEGINLFLAGAESSIRALQSRLAEDPALADLEYKESWSAHQPFKKMLVKLKAEIVPLGLNNVAPANALAPRVSASELRAWLDAERELVLLDVRNAFEVARGTFRRAVDLGLCNFRDFSDAAERLPEQLKRKTIVTFCTGGIRCEKAAPLLLKKGFERVYQLDGGILKYFEQCGGRHFEGECFVFDQREALDAALQPAGRDIPP
jgi:UPF0176 protein